MSAEMTFDAADSGDKPVTFHFGSHVGMDKEYKNYQDSSESLKSVQFSQSSAKPLHQDQ